MRKLSLLGMIVASGCGGPAAQPAPVANPASPQAVGDQAGECARVINTMLDRLMKTGDASPPVTDPPLPSLVHLLVGPMTASCTADEWSAATLHCYDTITGDDGMSVCEQTLTPTQRQHMDARAHAADAARAASAPAVSKAPVPMPPECDDYRTWIEKLAACPKLPPDTRDAMRSAFQQVSATWGDLPPEARAALGKACKTGADTVRQSYDAACK